MVQERGSRTPFVDLGESGLLFDSGEASSTRLSSGESGNLLGASDSGR